MHGVSEVIAIILILMIPISLAGVAYMFMSTTMSDVTASAGSTVSSTTSGMITSFVIESRDTDKIYVRNTGRTTLTNLTVYLTDQATSFNMTPETIVAGEVGALDVRSFMKDGDIVESGTHDELLAGNGFYAELYNSQFETVA